MTRVLTAALGLLLILAVTVWGPVWLFVLLVVLVAALGLDEFLSLVSALGRSHPGRWFLLPGAAVALSFALGPEWVLWTLAANVVLLSLVAMAGGRGAGQFEQLAFGTAGMLYTCLLPGFLLMAPRAALWVLIATVWAGDTAAYYGGRLLGKHRLAPVVSPHKTVEGAVAGGVASVLVGASLGSVFLDVTLPLLAGICLLTGVAGQLGDLSESALKRNAGVKDSANRLPGHGGILDRIDSLLFAAPVFLFLLMWAT